MSQRMVVQVSKRSWLMHIHLLPVTVVYKFVYQPHGKRAS